jgi:rhodanese-related sulfurtransferase
MMNNMRRILSILLILGTLIGMVCVSGTSAMAATVTTPQVQNLYAGRDILVGTVSVWNTATDLFVKYIIIGDWELAETRLAVATGLDGIPQTKTGNPVPGKFPYFAVHEPAVSQYTYTIPITSDWRYPNTGLKIAAYAAARMREMVDSEGAWAGGEQFDGANWATYFNYVRDLSPAETCAFIKAEPGTVILDVRPSLAFASGHLPGAINIPLGSSPYITFITLVTQLVSNQTFLVYCGSGTNGGIAAATMRTLGFVEVYNIAGGYSAWTKAGGCP